MEIRLSAFADEAAKDFGGQIKALKEEHIPYIELRGLDGKNVSELTKEQAKEYAARLKDNGISVWSIGSPLGKINMADDFAKHLELTRHVCELANVFGTDKIRMFSFYTATPEKDESEIIDRLGKMVEIATDAGVKLYHENEKEIFGDIAARCVRILDSVKGLECVFDPANFVQCNQDISAALDMLGSRAGYYHIKDVDSKSGALVPAGFGDGKIAELISRIEHDTVLTVEPHLAVFEGFANIDRTEMKHKFSYKSSREAFSAAVSGLRNVLTECGYVESSGKWVKSK